MARKGMNIYLRKDGRFECRYVCGCKTNGQKRYVSVYGKSYAELKEKLALSITTHLKGVDKSRKTSFGDVAVNWLAHVKKRVKESTFTNYTYLVKRHILPELGKTDMRKINSAIINKFIDKKLEKGKLKREQGLSKKYMQDILSVVKSIAKYAEEIFDIPYTLGNVRTPRPDKHDFDVMSDEEIKTLSDNLAKKHNIVNIAILLALFTGMRIGEVCGLKWEDYNVKDKTVSVRRTMQRISDNNGHTKLIVDSPKTKNSERTIPLNDKLCDILNNIKPKKGDCYIIGLEPNVLRTRFKKVMRRYGFDSMRYHDLRHNFASWCLRLHFDIKTLSEILGHSNAAMTLNNYAHTNMAIKRGYMNTMLL